MERKRRSDIFFKVSPFDFFVVNLVGFGAHTKKRQITKSSKNGKNGQICGRNKSFSLQSKYIFYSLPGMLS